MRLVRHQVDDGSVSVADWNMAPRLEHVLIPMALVMLPLWATATEPME